MNSILDEKRVSQQWLWLLVLLLLFVICHHFSKSLFSHFHTLPSVKPIKKKWHCFRPVHVLLSKFDLNLRQNQKLYPYFTVLQIFKNFSDLSLFEKNVLVMSNIFVSNNIWTCWSVFKSYLFMYPWAWNSTTDIAILEISWPLFPHTN